MEYREQFLTWGSKKRSGEKVESVRAIVVHYTAVGGASAQNIARYWKRTEDESYASAHVLVGDGEAVQVMPYYEVAFHVGSSTVAPQNAPHTYTKYGMSLIDAVRSTQYGKGMLLGRESITPNYCTIGVEMCQERQVQGSILISEETRANTIEIVRDLMAKYDVSTDDVVTHYEVVGWKACPAIAIGGASYGHLAGHAKEEIKLSRWWLDFKRELEA